MNTLPNWRVYPQTKLPNGKPAPGTKWRAFVDREGKTPSTKVRDTKKEAEQWAIDEAKRIAFQVSLSTPELRQVTVAYLMNWHLNEITPHRKTWKNETARLKRLMECDWAFLTLDNTVEITRQIKAWSKARRAAGLKGQSINRDLNCISGVFTKAREELEMIVPNPISDVPRWPEEDVRETLVWSQDDLNLFLDAVEFDPERKPTKPSHFMPWVLAILNATGLRPISLFATKLEWIDLQNRAIHYPADTVKNGEPYDCPLDNMALQWVKPLMEHMRAAKHTKLFPVGYGSVEKYFRDVRKRLAVDYPRAARLIIYGQRHTWTTVNVPLFANLTELLHYTGRKSVKDVMRYVKTDAATQAETLDRRRLEHEAKLAAEAAAKAPPAAPPAAPAVDNAALLAMLAEQQRMLQKLAEAQGVLPTTAGTPAAPEQRVH